MEELLFNRIMPIISFVIGIYLFIKFWQMRSLVDKQTIRLIKQVKSMWGENFGLQSGKSRSTAKDYKSGRIKVSNWIKSKAPLGILDELTPEEVQAYILNEDTINFLLKAKELLGGVELPSLPGRDRDRNQRRGRM